MKKIPLLIVLISCYSVVYGQFKLSLSYQQEKNKQNYEQLVTFRTGTEPILPLTKGNTTQVQAMWTLTPYLSVFTGLGYSSKLFNPNLSLPLFVISTPNGDFLGDPILVNHRFSNLEIPLGVRFNIPEYQNFEVGLSVAIVTAFTLKEIEVYHSSFSPQIESIEGTSFYENTWSHYGTRLDLSLDVLYNINTSWGIFMAYSWSPLDYRTLNSMHEDTIFILSLSSNTILKNGQKALRFGVVRSF